MKNYIKEIRGLIMQYDNINMNDGINVCDNYIYNREVIHTLYDKYCNKEVITEEEYLSIKEKLTELVF